MPGDRLRYDDPLGRWYNVVAGDRVALTVARGESIRQVAAERRTSELLRARLEIAMELAKDLQVGAARRPA